ncbi:MULTISPECIES: hypothetical protein [unclassified Pseudomonas]|uniref:hypothetical protein n=1 Tax=unclassified Pseudomonas TaxID=196821 RepID=UPI0038621B31
MSIRESTWDPEYTRTVRQRLELNAFPWVGKLPACCALKLAPENHRLTREPA